MTKEQRATKAAEDYTNMLLEATQYSGNKESDKKIFSVSSISVEPLQNWLAHKYGKSDKKQYGANTAGSIYQLGCDAATEKFADIERYESALRIKRELPNGWTISGEMDQLDHKLKVIIDNKVVSGSAYKEIMQNSPDHAYNMQLAGYKWLLEPQYGEYEAILSIVNKGGAAIRNDIYTTLHLNTHSTEDMEFAFIAATNELQQYIDLDVPPAQCDIFKYGKTKDIPNRCALYCDHNHHCPHYSPFKKEKDIISRLSLV